MASSAVAYLPLHRGRAYGGVVPEPVDRRTPWGIRIKERRDALGLTQLNVADAIHSMRPGDGTFSEQSVANLESGITQDPKLTTLRDLAKVLDVSIDWLVNGAEFKATEPATVEEYKRRICEQIDAMLAARPPSAQEIVVARGKDAAHRARRAPAPRRKGLPPGKR